jgi:hypothetical protein
LESEDEGVEELVDDEEDLVSDELLLLLLSEDEPEDEESPFELSPPFLLPGFSEDPLLA